jgi:regulator of sigma E protease
MAILSTLFYLALTFFLMGILIFVHELGHYLTARACKVTIHEFSLGMGKRLCGFTSKKTGIQYSMRLFPIGGYVAMAGEDEDKEGEEDDPNAFNKKNVWQRLIILVAGAAMNVITGALAMLILVGGMTVAGYKLPSTTVADFTPGASSYVTGLETGDKILRVDGVRVHTGYDLSYEIMFNGYKPVDVVVERDGKEILIPQVVFPSGIEDGIELGSMDF